ncbi:hypothetical protein G7075_12655 [Phycicoccus sp. HDW14]|uniref:hypothetical protein n=1 Tax=Phycicoccus sp. HDW14 TaxID=2714941 RepID=UPI001407F359|nr:hypothetical protein [Phycicoccus sp. HDW14]QIM21779.1 hypothetical protein G7075_12655 [Phycicoccus sp. HDW14]
MRVVRAVLGLLGAGAAGYGVLRLLRLPSEQVLAVLVWAFGGIVAHDGVLAPLVVGLGLAATALARWLRPSLVVLLVVLGPLTLVAVPVLGRFGARSDNPTLLDRPYLAGWLVVVGLAVAVAAVTALRARRSSSGDPVPGPPA